jgi:hypothetical protein
LGAASDTPPDGRLDTTGASVDPFDDVGVWIIQAYTLKAKTGVGYYQYVVGKVLGTVNPDIWPNRESLRLNLDGRGAAKVTGTIGNQGDGDAKAVKLTAVLVPTKRARGARGTRRLTYTLGSVTIGTLKSGDTQSFVIDGKVPRRTPKANYRLRVIASTSTKPQYDKQNDAATTLNTVTLG